MSQTSSFAIVLYDIIPSEALVRAVKTHKDIPETALLFGTKSAKSTDVTRSSSAIGTDENLVQPSLEPARRTPLRDNGDKAQLSCIDLRVQREPDQLAEDEEHKKRSLIQLLFINVLQSPNKDNLMTDYFKARRHRVSRDVTFSKNKALSELFKFWMITDAVQCTSCYKDATPGHTSRMWTFSPGASEEVKKQVLKNVINCFNILTTSASVFKT